MRRAPLALLFALVLSGAVQAEATLDEALGGFDEPDVPTLYETLGEYDDEGRPGIKEALGGFDEPADRPAAPGTTPTAATGGWRRAGSLTASTAWNFAHAAPLPDRTDHRGLSRLRLEAQGRLDRRWDNGWRARLGGRAHVDPVYALRSDANYTTTQVAALETEAELQEVYLWGPLHDRVDLKIGRQIVVWGMADSLRVTDLLNPLDRREPGLVDLEDLRLPVTMTRLDVHRGDWQLSLVGIHEIRFDKRPPYGSDFHPGSVPMPPETRPDSALLPPEVGVALTGTLPGWDIGLYAARLYHDPPRFDGSRLVHDRISMAGLAADWVTGPWLFKLEAARLQGLRFATDPGNEHARLDLLLGADYSGLRDITLGFEAVQRSLQGFTPAMANPPDSAVETERQLALRATWNLQHDRLKLTGMAVAFGTSPGSGGFQRLGARYELRDGLHLAAAVINYDSGNRPTDANIGDNDRITVEVKWSF